MFMNFVKKLTFGLSILLFAAVFAAAQTTTGSIIGKVRDNKGKSLEGVVVEAKQDGKSFKKTETDDNGKFRLSDLEVGRYTIVFDKAGFSTAALTEIEVRAKKKNNLGDRLSLSIDQGTLVIVEASVYNQNGFVLYGAKVEVEEVLSDGTTKKVGAGVSSRDGDVVFRFPEKATTYRVTASVKGLSATKDVTVNEAAIYRTALTLDLSKDGK